MKYDTEHHELKFRVSGKGGITLSPADFIAQGGEAMIYAKGATAYKIYSDARKMIPTEKIQELSTLDDARIIRPVDVLLDERNTPVGFSMRHVVDARALCRMFPAAFRQRVGLSSENTFALVRKLQEGIEHIHRHGILIVDVNEMNFLITPEFDDVLFIDTDSYQTKSFPATALMDSVRDRHATRFDENTDWFSFGIVAFQMFTGLHPYKGTHPATASFPKNEQLERRMRANISVFHEGVGVPPSCLRFDVIPPLYLSWFHQVFENGARLPPPREAQDVINLSCGFPSSGKPIPTNGEAFRVTELFELDDVIIDRVCHITLTHAGIFDGERKLGNAPLNAKIAVTPKTHQVIIATLENGRLRFRNATRDEDIKVDLTANALMASEGRIYLKRGTQLAEVAFVELSERLLIQTHHIGNAARKATQLFEGVAIQNLLGACYVSLFPVAGVCHQVRIKELENHRIIDAKFACGVLMVIGERHGSYDKFILRFDGGFYSYDARILQNIIYSGINFTVLDTGICLHLNEDGDLEIFSNRRGTNELKIIPRVKQADESNDSAVLDGAKLFHHGGQALFAHARKLYKFNLTLRDETHI